MKNRLLTLFTVVACALLPAFSSCEKEFNPRDKYKDITIVYGLVNPIDTFHYIRIHKAFLGPEDILLMAKEPDSSLYPVEDIDVRVYEVDKSGNSTQIPVYIKEIVDKDSGAFYYPKINVYCFDKIFEKTSSTGEYRPTPEKEITIKIEVENKKTGKITYAETPLVHNFNVRSPQRNLALDIDPSKSSATFKWNNAKYGRIYDVYYTMRYQERKKDASPQDFRVDSIVWHVGQCSAPSTGNGNEQTQNFNFNPGAFYAQIIRDVPYNDDVWRTPYDAVRVDIWCGSEDLYYYHNINRPGGIVQERPEYTNLKTKIYSEELGSDKELEKESFGIFTSRIVQSIPLHLSPKMTQEYLPDLDRQFKSVTHDE